MVGEEGVGGGGGGGDEGDELGEILVVVVVDGVVVELGISGFFGAAFGGGLGGGGVCSSSASCHGCEVTMLLLLLCRKCFLLRHHWKTDILNNFKKKIKILKTRKNSKSCRQL